MIDAYKLVKGLDSGTYVWCDTDATTTVKLQAFCHMFQKAGLDFLNATEFHTTVMYSKDNPDIMEFPQPQKLRGLITNACQLGDYLVLKLDSPSLQRTHKQLLKLGFSHSFDDYTPHISVAKIEESELRVAKQTINKINKELQNMDFKCGFTELKCSFIGD